MPADTDRGARVTRRGRRSEEAPPGRGFLERPRPPRDDGAPE